ncbi:carnitine O-acetyltransferase Yat2p [[Candida] railenensis]|uniref:Carnitine O-acetyltransferase Yat2p n=1 Tax=[Candida] railenensis TaxID=45579 RepID=A0A9P0QRE7_9ASCO|nr:carnitine O-acetyltransferase Yat2p [[Candida] railenensis]
MSTFSYEDDLPHLPVPSLSSTTQQLLAALKPLLSPDEYGEVLEDATKFVSSKYINLIQDHLVKASTNESHSCYLNSINDEVNPGIYGELNNDILPRNPYLVLEEDPYSKTINPPNQAQRAASLINSSLKFIVSLRNETLKPDLTPKNKNPLTMNCYRNLFGSTRVPEENHVTIERHEDSAHIMVICNNQFYELEVIKTVPENEGSATELWFNDHELSLLLQSIIDGSSQSDAIETVNNSIGSLTTQTFKMWKLSRKELSTSNPKILHSIDSSLFVVVLDFLNSPETDQEKTSVISHGSSNLLPGTNIQVGSCTSRWYDKLQMIVTKNSVAGVVWESASMDSTAILRYISDIYTDSILKLAKDINGLEYSLFNTKFIKFASTKDNPTKPEPRPLSITKTPELFHLIHLSETRLADLINQHEYKTMTLKFDSNLISKFHVPVDSFLQICFQIAYYTLYGKLVNTLEPITTRKFKDARTELIPVQNDPITRLVKTFISKDDQQVKWKRFKECCEIHSKQYLDAMQGRGFQRHFLALAHCVRSPDAIQYLNNLNPDLPSIPPLSGDTEIPLLSNPSIDKISSPELLISNCGNPALHLFGITPAIDQGFGIGYIIHSDKVIITISSKFRQTERFLDTFKSVVIELKQIIQNQSNFLFKLADTEARKAELQNVTEENPKNSIDLTIDVNKRIPLENSSNSSGSSRSTPEKANFDVFGGYGYFDFGELDNRSFILSHNQSHLNSEISISLPHSHSSQTSNSNSRLQSRNHSNTNLHKLNLSDDMKHRMTLSESIRDRLQSTESVNVVPEKKTERSKNMIGKELKMNQI